MAKETEEEELVRLSPLKRLIEVRQLALVALATLVLGVVASYAGSLLAERSALEARVQTQQFAARLLAEAEKAHDAERDARAKARDTYREAAEEAIAALRDPSISIEDRRQLADKLERLLATAADLDRQIDEIVKNRRENPVFSPSPPPEKRSDLFISSAHAAEQLSALPGSVGLRWTAMIIILGMVPVFVVGSFGLLLFAKDAKLIAFAIDSLKMLLGFVIGAVTSFLGVT